MNIIELKSGDSIAKINLSRGANCISLNMEVEYTQRDELSSLLHFRDRV